MFKASKRLACFCFRTILNKLVVVSSCLSEKVKTLHDLVATVVVRILHYFDRVDCMYMYLHFCCSIIPLKCLVNVHCGSVLRLQVVRGFVCSLFHHVVTNYVCCFLMICRERKCKATAAQCS